MDRAARFAEVKADIEVEHQLKLDALYLLYPEFKPKPRAENAGVRKLNDAQESEVMELLRAGEISETKIGEKFDVSRKVIARIRSMMPSKPAKNPIAEAMQEVADRNRQEEERIAPKTTSATEPPPGMVAVNRGGVVYFRKVRGRGPAKPNSISSPPVSKRGRPKLTPSDRADLFAPKYGQICESCNRLKAACKCAGCAKMICGLCARRQNGQCKECEAAVLP